MGEKEDCVVPENIHTPTAEGHWKFRGGPGGGGVLKAKIFKLKGMYEPKLEFPERWGGGGSNQKNPPWGDYGYFLEQHICTTKRSWKNLHIEGIKLNPLLYET